MNAVSAVEYNGNKFIKLNYDGTQFHLHSLNYFDGEDCVLATVTA